MRRVLLVMFGVCVVILSACGKGTATSAVSPMASAASSTSPSADTYAANGVSFDYPHGWQSLDITASSASTNGTVAWQQAFGPGPGADFVSLTDYSLSASVTADNIDQREPSTTTSITSIFEQAGGSLTSGPDKITMGGLPALGYAGTAIDPDGNQVNIRMVLAYDGTTEYFVNCQESQADSSVMGAACDQIISSFSLTST